MSKSVFFRFLLSKKSAFAPYSPIRLGVAKEIVSDARLCLSAVLKFIFSKVETKVCHFKISKNQLAVAKKPKNNNEYIAIFPLEKIVAVNSLKLNVVLLSNLKKIYPNVIAIAKTLAAASRYCLALWGKAIIMLKY